MGVFACTSLCLNRTTERYRLRLCEADMKLDVGLPQQSNYYGERCRFLHGYQKAGDLSCLKNLTYCLAIYNTNSDISGFDG